MTTILSSRLHALAANVRNASLLDRTALSVVLLEYAALAETLERTAEQAGHVKGAKF